MTPETKPINIKQLKMKAEYALLESIRDELRKIRQLMDKQGRFEESSIAAKPVPKPEREVAESDDGSHLRVTTSESKPIDVVNWDPENIKWKQTKNAEGEPFEIYPFKGEKIESTPDYENLRNAILAVKQSQTGKFGLMHKGMFYFLFTDNATLGRKPKKPFKKR